MHYLAAMKDLSVVKDYNWGGAALTTLYSNIGVASRSKNLSMGGYGGILVDLGVVELRILGNVCP